MTVVPDAPGSKRLPGTVAFSVPKKAITVIRRRRRRSRRPVVTLERHPDDLPKRGLFTEPIRVTKLDALEPRMEADESLVDFVVEVKDAEGRRCPDLAVEATVSGPVRSATVQGTTDMMGRLRFRMRGPRGRYHIAIGSIAPGGLDWDVEAGPREATIDVS